MTLYPWLVESFQRCARRGRDLPHAILLTGPKGIGKMLFAQELARSLLCSGEKNLLGCGICYSCTLFSGDSHPDYHLLTSESRYATDSSNLFSMAVRYLIEPAKKTGGKTNRRQVISVDQVRMLISELSVTSHVYEGKVIVICTADEMNINAANALLKVLEEPTSNTYFILVSEATLRLPSTIRSRCSAIEIPSPSSTISLNWLESEIAIERGTAATLLEVAGGSPVTAFQLYIDDAMDTYVSLADDLQTIMDGNDNPERITNKWAKADIRIIASWLQRQILNAVRSGLQGDSSENSKTLFLYLGGPLCLTLYDQLGMFLLWPTKAVDEILFLEAILIQMFDPMTARDLKRQLVQGA